MTCEHCTNFVKMTVNELEGVTACAMSLEEGTATVSYDANKITANQIVEAVDDTHFSVSK